jgi:3-isopropylmalate/(R)-2-methylmalate dehydratase large subunit
MGMTIAEKILARQSGRAVVRPGDLVVANVETCVLLDTHFNRHAAWRWPTELHDPDKVVLVADHIVVAANPDAAVGLRTMRQVASYYGIKRVHDAGANQGISHQVIADMGYALPGTVLANPDSHTVSAGAFNCVARGLGRPELLQILCTGQTWYLVAPTVRYELVGELPKGVTAKDAFLYLAGRWGSHENQSIEFGGPAQAGLSLNARRTLSTMCAEVSAEFATWGPDDLLLAHMRARTDRPFFPTWPDADAQYVDVRTINLSELEPYVSGIDGVIHNTQPLSEFHDKIRLDQCVVGSCANGTLDDLAEVAEIVKGRQVAPWVRFIVTPGSQAIYREAARLGLLSTIAQSGALVTVSACGACAAQDFGTLAPGEVCLTATTRNYKGRMGASQAKIHMASPATVAASAITGYITHPRDLQAVDAAVGEAQ